MKARLTDEYVRKPSDEMVFVHAYMIYKCRNCGKRYKMYCEKGIEEGGENHKPSPFIIRCKCGGFAQDISGLEKLGFYAPLEKNMSYFANKNDSDCGVPILR